LRDVEKAIRECREAIDRTDEKLLELLNERARYNAEIGRLKASDEAEVFVPSRELEVFERLEARNPGPFPTSAIRNVFREIISASVFVQRGVKVAYLGPLATYTHQAAIQQFGLMADFTPSSTISEIFRFVESGTVEFGVVPIENSTEGVVSHTLDLFVDSELTICAEVHVAVHHDLLSKSGDIRQVASVHSHPQALAQCRAWLERNVPNASQHPTHTTALAAEFAASDETIAAIASPIAGPLHGLRVIRSGIEDNPDNTTRFLVIGRTPAKPSARDITSVLFSIKRDQVGALFRALEPFAKHGVNLTRIESRPTKVKAWEYVFFCDFEGHIQDPAIDEAIRELRPRCDFVKVLGSYPRAGGS
jgi:chorismate mutase/prephenate dehydratase